MRTVPGKTTAMRYVCGLCTPTFGRRVGWLDFDIARQSEAVKKNIGYMSQKFSLYEDLKVWENLRLFGGIYGMKTKTIASETDRILHELGFEKRAEYAGEVFAVGLETEVVVFGFYLS